MFQIFFLTHFPIILKTFSIQKSSLIILNNQTQNFILIFPIQNIIIFYILRYLYKIHNKHLLIILKSYINEKFQSKTNHSIKQNTIITYEYQTTKINSIRRLLTLIKTSRTTQYSKTNLK